MLLSALLSCYGTFGQGKDTLYLHLNQAISYAKLHNHAYQNKQTDVEIAKKKVVETRAIGLPQIEATLSNENYFDVPTTLMPDFISQAVYGVNMQAFGLTPTLPLPKEQQYFPVKFGTKHNASAGATLSQLLFSGEYLVGLQASKAYVNETRQQLVKDELQLVEQISNTYYLILTLQHNKALLQNSLHTNEQLHADTKAMYEAGFVEDTDVEQLEVMLYSLRANINNMDMQIANAVSLFKIYLGVDNAQPLRLKGSLAAALAQADGVALGSRPMQLHENIDFVNFLQQKKLVALQLKQERSKYLPQLSAFVSAKANAMRDSYNFFDTKERWYPTTLWGLQLKVPLWSSGARHARVKQAQLNYKKMQESEQELKQQLQLQLQTARNNLRTAYDEYGYRQKNLTVSKKIYDKYQIKYKEGMSSSFDLQQAQNNFIQASADYSSAVMHLMQNRNRLQRLLSKASDYMP